MNSQMTVDELLKNVGDGEPIASDVACENFFRIAYQCIRQREEINALNQDRDDWKSRAEAAEAELRKAREQEPVAYRIDWSDGLVELAWQADGYDEDYVEIRGLPTAVPLGEMPCAAPKPAALAVPDALRMELEWLEGWLHCMAEPMGQACCKRSMFECCGYPDPVYPDIAHIGAAMSKRRNDVIALLQSADHSEQAHEMVDAVNRRCEACAILPCSCK